MIRCSDTVLASCSVEAAQITELYGADPARIRIVAPGVDHAFFGPGGPRARPGGPSAWPGAGRCSSSSAGSSRSKGWRWPCARWPPCPPTVPTPAWWWWAGRAVPREMPRSRGPRPWSGNSGWETGWSSCRPGPHELLSTYYRAADVCLVPSRSESFGLVALEAAACGTPVVASDVGGLRSLVDHGRTGYLVEDPAPEAFAAWVRQILAEPLLAERLSTGAVLRARRYTWFRAAHLLREVYDELTAGRLVECS